MNRKPFIILNLIIMLLSAAAVAFLLITPVVDIKSEIGLRTNLLDGVAPTNEYVDPINMEELVGDKDIKVNINFKVNKEETVKLMNHDRSVLLQKVVYDNLDPILTKVHTIISEVSEIALKSGFKNYTKKEVAKLIDATGASSATVMSEAGMDDTYFANISNLLYEEAYKQDASVNSILAVVDNKINTALTSVGLEYNETAREDNRAAFSSALATIGLIKDGVLIDLNTLPYVYFSTYLQDDLQYKVEKELITQRDDENIYQYSDRLFIIFLEEYIAGGVIYDIAIALFIAMFFFGAIWVAAFIIAFVRLIHDPFLRIQAWFWALGAPQVVAGIAAFIVFKFIVPNNDYSHINGLPFNNLNITLLTYALIPSIMYLIMIPVCIIYKINSDRELYS